MASQPELDTETTTKPEQDTEQDSSQDTKSDSNSTVNMPPPPEAPDWQSSTAFYDSLAKSNAVAHQQVVQSIQQAALGKLVNLIIKTPNVEEVG
jgi:hypothetical protein